MPGFALLPTLEDPTSTLTFRLSTDEMQERNEWILGAHNRGISLKEIAYEVGLSEQRVGQIIKPAPSQQRKQKTNNFMITRPKARQQQTNNGIGCGVVQFRTCDFCKCMIETVCTDAHCVDAKSRYSDVPCLTFAATTCSKGCWSLALMMEE